jgi:hypothetical protein
LEFFQVLHIQLKLREKTNNLAQELAQRVIKEWRMRQGITDSGPLPLGPEQIRGAQSGEVAGNEWL